MAGSSSLADHIKDLLDDLQVLAPWLNFPDITATLNEAGNVAGIPNLYELNDVNDFLLQETQRLKTENISGDITAFEAAVNESARNISNRLKAIDDMAQQSHALTELEWDFLYDKSKKLMSISYNLPKNTPARFELLRLARIGGAVDYVRCNCPGNTAARKAGFHSAG